MSDGKKGLPKKREIENVEIGKRADISRRRFLVEAGGSAIALTVLTAAGIPAAGDKKSEIEFLQSSCGEDTSGKKVLVAYASRCGTTGEVADAIAKQICAAGAAAQVKLIKEVDDLSEYSAVVVGSAIRAAKWLAEASNFVKLNNEALSKIPVAYFMTCLQIVPEQPAIGRGASKDETVEQARQRVLAYIDPVLEKWPQVKPVDIGVFAGALDFSILKRGERTMMKSMKFVEGDFRNFEEINGWAKSVAPALLKA